MNKPLQKLFGITLLAILTQSIFIAPLAAQGQFTFEDVMQFEDIKTPVISADGRWVGYSVWPEVGDGEAVIKSVDGRSEYSVERGERPQIASNSRWAGLIVQPPYIEKQNAGRDAPRQGATFINTADGETVDLEEVRNFSFSNSGEWAIIRHYQGDDISTNGNSKIGSPVTVRNLANGESNRLDFVHESAVDSTSRYFAYSVVDTLGIGNGLYLIDLEDDLMKSQKIAGSENSLYSNLTWDHDNSRLAYTESKMDTDHEYLPGDATIYSMQIGNEPIALVTPGDVESGYRLRDHNNLVWTHDNKRLFYGVMDAEMVALDEMKEDTDSVTADNLYDLDRILNDIEGKVWHWDDPQIKTHEKQTWNSRKNHLFTSVHHVDSGRSVQLATKVIPDVRPAHNSGKILGSSDLPYQKLRTWDGTYRDYYLIDLETGNSEQFLEKQRFGASLSPNGNFVSWFDGADWHIMHTDNGTSRNLTAEIDIPFYDEDNDRPQPSSSYRIAGWTDGDRHVLIYDKFDIWQFDTRNGEYVRITEGREDQRIYRIRDLNPDQETIARNERLFLTMFHDREKNYGFYEARVGRTGTTRIIEENKRFNIVDLAEESDHILFTQETYQEYPNLWVASDRRFRNPVQVTNLHEDLLDRFAWGEAELIDWLNMDGKTVQGILIYPGDYDPNKRYPVFIYYYERYSQRLYDFNKPVTNHRPNLAQYASDGYAVFLPDIWFDVPIPGYSATKNLVPGVQKLVEMGVADPDAIGLHGHSWSGYLTAQVVTQTDIFAAAVAGAPVGNMTSAYSGIRWGSGLARQFQYEQTQSRLGVSMWENLAPYIENSPVFFADRINTPIMIQHGDADEAVPWYQSIELYLALRRLDKESVFLHYYDEPHHLRKMANRLDYAIKMKEYMDHYLKGEPAPAWITDGVPYLGE
ncbi:alpha/beta hydrolase family protein [Rhodohalobacter halophilus]|uniref:alpha/beta hydrolase family protein n=1 Tax=Rhodohalobacter halophilus TaxID=1812810 RepID=UPI0015B3E78B|nr:prolyl oligopeptidase family serine peptidase [Rhodohalobacter halophilus]